MRVVVIGLGIQGRKRAAAAGADVMATVDPVQPDAKYRTIYDVPLNDFNAALVCTPDSAKAELVRYLLGNRKHVLVEKPLLEINVEAIGALSDLSRSSRVICYTAYNHRFEPNFIRMRDLLVSGELGRIYRCRMFYGNGTARDVHQSPWRDKGAGVLADLGPHLLDTALFWFGSDLGPFRLVSCRRFENAAFDHVVIMGNGRLSIELEMTYVSWRNHFRCDVFAEHGSAHIDSLCKWGPSTFTRRWRRLPSGRPDEESITLVQSDPTWEKEYLHFQALCAQGEHALDNDVWISSQLVALSAEAMLTDTAS